VQIKAAINNLVLFPVTARVLWV